MVLRARFDGKVFIPEGPVGLPADRLVDLDVREVEVHPKGSPAALLQAIQQLPHLQPGDAEALLEAIKSGEQPVQSGGVFDEPDTASSRS